MQVKLIIAKRILYLASLWMWEGLELGNGLSLEEEEIKFKAQKIFGAPGETWTHDPPSSRSDAITTELLAALW